MKATYFLLALFTFALPARGAECEFESKPQVLENVTNPSRLLILWDESSSTILNSAKLPLSTPFLKYRNAVERSVHTDPYFLLERYARRAPRPDDLHNIDAVLSGVGEIRDVRCAEALLLDFQIQRNPDMLFEPTEFLAYFLENNGKLRIYLLTNDSEGVGGMSRLVEEISKSIKSGWKIVGNLHNHSFSLGELKSNRPQGVLAPSGNDMRVFNGHARDLGLPRAFITNGFHTVILTSESFPLFRAADFSDLDRKN